MRTRTVYEFSGYGAQIQYRVSDGLMMEWFDVKELVHIRGHLLMLSICEIAAEEDRDDLVQVEDLDDLVQVGALKYDPTASEARIVPIGEHRAEIRFD